MTEAEKEKLLWCITNYGTAEYLAGVTNAEEGIQGTAKHEDRAAELMALIKTIIENI